MRMLALILMVLLRLSGYEGGWWVFYFQWQQQSERVSLILRAVVMVMEKMTACRCQSCDMVMIAMCLKQSELNS